MLERIHRLGRTMRIGQVPPRYKIVLGQASMANCRKLMEYAVCASLKPGFTPSNAEYPSSYCLSQIVVDPFSRHRHTMYPSDITDQPNPEVISPEILERLLVFKELGGTEEEFNAIQLYLAIQQQGKKALPLPPNVEVVPRYRDGYDSDPRTNPEMEGLVEVRIEGDTDKLDVHPVHTRWHHLFHPPFASTGLALNEIALALFAAIEPSVIERIQAIQSQVTNYL